MLDFENEHLSLIELYAKNALDIERTIFTKLYGLNEHHYSLLAIQSIAILYSYWEGYVQKSFQLYIDFINEQSVPFNMLSKEIIVFHMDNVFKQFSEYPRTVQKKIVFFDKLNAHFTTEKHEIYRIVNTQSNVDFKILPGKVAPGDFTGRAIYSDLTPAIRFDSGNKKLNRLAQNALWGQRSNFLDMPTDCPQRDVSTT